MRIGAFDPYLATRGGGERYFLELCLAVAHRHPVEIVVPTGHEPDGMKAVLQETFGLDLGDLLFVASRSTQADTYHALLDHYAAVITVTNDYPPLLHARTHISVLQFPWGVTSWSAIHRWRARRGLRRCDLVLVYSRYVEGWVRRSLGYAPVILEPPVAPISTASGESREPVILAVGRFTSSGHNKKHELLVRAFAEACERGLVGWRLVLAGGARPDDELYVARLRAAGRGLPVEVVTNVDRAGLESLYRRASLFWHATGFGEDAHEYPERMEHFGIAPIEAMSAGCVPLVVRLGGLPEIVVHGHSGVLWDTEDQLVDWTLRLASDRAALAQLSAGAVARAADFDRETFRRRLAKLLPPTLSE